MEMPLMSELLFTSLARARRAGVAPKIVHRAHKVNANGDVKALCFKVNRKIDLAIATWTLVDEHTTCAKCRAIIGLDPSPKG